MAKLVEDQAAQAAQAQSAQTPTIPAQVDGTKPVDPAAQTATEKKLSPKNKLSRGVSEDTVTTWVPFDQSKEQNEMLRKVAAVRNEASLAQTPPGPKVTIGSLLVSVLKYGLTQYEKQFAEDAAKYVESAPKSKAAKKIEDMSPEDAIKYAEGQEAAAQKRVAAAKEMIAKARERAQAAKAAEGATA